MPASNACADAIPDRHRIPNKSRHRLIQAGRGISLGFALSRLRFALHPLTAPADCGQLAKLMKHKFLMALLWMMIASLPLLGQEKLYPVRGNKDVPALLTADRSAIVLEKAFQHKLTLG